MRPLERHYQPIRPSNRQPHDSIRWFVVGAHQAGCSPARISDMTYLSESAVRNIIRNFQHTGSPSLRRLPNPGTRIPGLITADDVVQHVLQQAQEQSLEEVRARGAYTSRSMDGSKEMVGSELDIQQAYMFISHQQHHWTQEDDRVLLEFVLDRVNGSRWGEHRWEQLSSTLQARHSARECEERWDKLRPILLGAMSISGTQGW
ncbi:hypothetical protein O0I10_012709 [Lichtheimia ornata]|uniref:Myb-like domain-containing protein n=1 Tax=Lichtheimia ornata TaxID=688661 RepID=A0AAD7URE3_9FUNG|nr:uncharacterized protein O0I10_012709 [Lichtheimia ornata]KAJ8651721.1 hypothetical protein O0I10_012709 [Lichtheimia ornata]